MAWESVIGLEVHAQLKTNTKIFSGASTAFGAEPNTQACLVDLGMPGVLPVLNREAVKMAIAFGLAVGGQVKTKSVFARKNYFYPDLPKGYQISQFDLPIVEGGSLAISDNGKTKTIGITRAHLEEDAGKSLHDTIEGKTAIDLNRAGTPLLEIVSEPDLRTSTEAITYLKNLHNLVRHIEICDGNMQEGSFRVDANVSVRPQGQQAFGTRCEIKNLNSFRFIDKAIQYEIKRQIAIIEGGGSILQETRLFDTTKGETRSMRSKEEANDYRYFPDPDLFPLDISKEEIESIAKSLPELPEQTVARFKDTYQLNDYDARLLGQDKWLASYFQSVLTHNKISAKLAANWILGDLSSLLNKTDCAIDQSPISAQMLSELLARIEDGTISGKIAKEVLDMMWQTEKTADTIISEKGLKQVNDPALIAASVDKVIDDHPEQLAQYQAGKTKLFGFFVGKVMQATGGKANPAQINELLKEKLAKGM